MNPVALDARSAVVGLLAVLGAAAVVSLLTRGPAMRKNGSRRGLRARSKQMRRNGKSLTPRQQIAAERRAAASRRRDAAAITRAARERAKDARLTATDRARGTKAVCKEATKRRARIRAAGKRARAALDARIARAVAGTGGRCAASRAETSRARAELRDRRMAFDIARGPQSVALEHRRRLRAAEKEQLLSRDAIDSALSADLAPALVNEAARTWFTKSGRLRAPARAAARGSRAKLFEAFQEYIAEHENDLWQSVTERQHRAPF